MFRYFSIRCFCLWCEKSFHKFFHLFGELWLLPTLLFVVVFVGCIFIKSSFVRTSFVVTVVYLESMKTTTTTKNRYVHMYGCRWKFNLIWFDLRFLRTTAHKFMYVCMCLFSTSYLFSSTLVHRTASSLASWKNERIVCGLRWKILKAEWERRCWIDKRASEWHGGMRLSVCLYSHKQV